MKSKIFTLKFVSIWYTDVNNSRIIGLNIFNRLYGGIDSEKNYIIHVNAQWFAYRVSI